MRQVSDVNFSHSNIKSLSVNIVISCVYCGILQSNVLLFAMGATMLISFSVANFLSFKEKQTITLNAGLVRKKSERLYKDKTGNRLVKFTALFGANASGKSNFVEAIGFSRRFVLRGFPSESTKLYCRTDDDCCTQSTLFEYELLIDGRMFRYSIECNLEQRTVEKELLIELIKEEEKVIFSRDIASETYNILKFKDHQLNAKLEIYASDIKEEKGILFLSVLNQNKTALYSEHAEAVLFKSLYTWFEDQLSVNFPNRMISPYSYFLSTENREIISKILQAYDTGITGYSIVDNTKEMLKAQIPEDMYKSIITDLLKMKESKKTKAPSIILRGPREFFILKLDDNDNLVSETLQFSHKASSSLFGIDEESDGTTRLMDLLTVLLDKRDEAVYVIDEIDRCLHPQLTTRFVMDFLYLASRRNIQLIVTTHESALLDFEILRKDEIWFVNKEEGASQLYPLEDFSERFDKKIEYAYRNGEYKAKPNFENIYPLLDSFLDS